MIHIQNTKKTIWKIKVCLRLKHKTQTNKTENLHLKLKTKNN